MAKGIRWFRPYSRRISNSANINRIRSWKRRRGETIRGGLKGLFVGKVLTCEEHPNSDHLHITTVDLGKGEPQQIVCGAANVAAGQKVIVADLGCVLYDGEDSFVIKKANWEV